MKKVIALIISLTLIFVSNSLYADKSEYLAGFQDGQRIGSEPICLAVVPQICDEKGNLLPEDQRIYNGEPRCYVDVLENCYEIKEKNSVSKKRLKRLKNKIKRFDRN